MNVSTVIDKSEITMNTQALFNDRERTTGRSALTGHSGKQAKKQQRVVSASPLGASSSSLNSSNFSIGLMMKEDNGKEARIEEAQVETKEELEDGEVREEACRSAAVVGRVGVGQKGERE